MSRKALLLALKKAREAKTITMDEYDAALDDLINDTSADQNESPNNNDQEKETDLETAINQDNEEKKKMAELESAVDFLHSFDSFFDKHGESLGQDKEEFTKFLKFGKNKPEQAKILKQQIIKAFFKNSDNYKHASEEQKKQAESILSSNDDSLDLVRAWDNMQSNININSRLAEQSGGDSDKMDSSKTIPNVHNFFASNKGNEE